MVKLWTNKDQSERNFEKLPRCHWCLFRRYNRTFCSGRCQPGRRRKSDGPKTEYLVRGRYRFSKVRDLFGSPKKGVAKTSGSRETNLSGGKERWITKDKKPILKCFGRDRGRPSVYWLERRPISGDGSV